MKYKKFTFLNGVLFFSILSIIISLSLSEIVYFFLENRDIFKVFDAEKDFKIFLISSTIVSPIIETIIFVLALEGIHYIAKLISIKNSELITIIIIGITFGMLHWYNIYYILINIPLWMIDSYAYFSFKHNNFRTWKIILGLILIHSLYNAVNIYIDYIL